MYVGDSARERRVRSQIWRLGRRAMPVLYFVLRVAMLSLAYSWRRCLFRTTIVAITGSVGKTSAKDAIAAILRSRYRVISTKGSNNHSRGMFLTLMRVRPWHRFAVIELGLSGPGQMKWMSMVLQPDVAVWVNVARTHTMQFKTLETVAREKSLLVSGLRPGGVAILNRDNPYIAAYAPPAGVRTVYYGSGAGADFRWSEAESRWPERLRFTMAGGGETVAVESRFVGRHWTSSLMAGMATCAALGVRPAASAAVIARLEPPLARLSPMEVACGATILRDEHNGSVDTLEVAIAVMEEAEAERKIIVFSDVSDSKQKPRRRANALGRTAARVADAVVFIGEHGGHGVAAAVEAGMDPGQVWHFYDIEAAANHMKKEVRRGDLVLLRGRATDHLSRIYLAMTGEVGCWRNTCERLTLCDGCPELRKRRG